MKKLALLALTGILFSCNSNGYKISGEIKNVKDGTLVFLEKKDEKLGQITVDSAKIKDNKFYFEGNVKDVEMHTIRFQNLRGALGVILEPGDLDIKVNKDSIFRASVKGSYNNDEMTAFNTEGYKMSKKVEEFEQKNMPVMQVAMQKNDTATVNRLRKEYAVFQEKFDVRNEKYIKTHPKSFVSVLLVESFLKEFEPKYDKIKSLYDGLDNELKKSKPGRVIKIKLDGLELVNIGQKAPGFVAQNPEGKMVSLKESLGKVTIIDFWASWCAPCRKENPNFVALYKEFHPKGLNFIGVALEQKGQRDKWIEAIKKDNLNWIHVSNLQYWDDPIVKKYSLDGLPSTFILDKNGIIVAKNLRGAELRAKVEELLAKQ